MLRKWQVQRDRFPPGRIQESHSQLVKNPAPTRTSGGEAGRIFFSQPAKIISRPDPEARRGARADLFSQPGHAGSGLDFLFRGPGRGWIFFRGPAGLGSRLDFFFRNGAGFFVLRLGSDPGTLMKPLRSSLLHVRMVQHPLLHPIVTHGRWVWEWGGLLQHQLDAGGAVSRAGYQVPW